ncbi:MAG TPA: hypothetical protein VNQ77_08580 [Frankiaceae bacterium]|nr:hypothetical protein [Frankiaceae bacterium]
MSAFTVPLGIDAVVHVDPDFTACATVTADDGTVFAGTFTAVGYMQGPGTKAATVRGATPVSGAGFWYGCISGAYSGATVGEAKYVLNAHGETGDVAVVIQCVINRGSLTCV